MKIYIKKRYKIELNKEIISKILSFLNIANKDYEIEYTSGNGRCIIIETDNMKYYVIVSRQIADSRNAFLAQYIPTVLSEYIDDITTKEKSIYIFLLDTSENAKTNFIIDTYRVAKTLGIDIINEKDLNISPIQPYNTFIDWKNAKTSRQQYNPSNRSSYAIEDDNKFTMFGKLYGANGKEASFMACQLAKIATLEKKSLNFIQVKEHGSEEISTSDRNLLEHFGVNISKGSIILNGKQTNDKSTCRKQDEFIYNLLEKYGPKKCYLCDCNIESSIIASHIHRITDLDKSALTFEEKRKQAVDANNGFWLCANHDKMFEEGIITFDKTGNLIINPQLKESQIAFIKSITKVNRIQDNHITEDMINYLLKHNIRVNLGLD